MASVSPNPPPESQLLLPLPSGAETRALRENQLRATPANRKPEDLRAVAVGRVSPPLGNAEILADLAQGIFLGQRKGGLASDRLVLIPLDSSLSSIEGERRAGCARPPAVR
jgi:hypothetical protein